MSDSESDELIPLADLAKESNIRRGTAQLAAYRHSLKAQRRGRDWYATRADWLAWVNDPDRHRPGRKKKV